jgi:hypothetical protein
VKQKWEATQKNERCIAATFFFFFAAAPADAERSPSVVTAASPFPPLWPPQHVGLQKRRKRVHSRWCLIVYASSISFSYSLFFTISLSFFALLFFLLYSIDDGFPLGDLLLLLLLFSLLLSLSLFLRILVRTLLWHFSLLLLLLISVTFVCEFCGWLRLVSCVACCVLLSSLPHCDCPRMNLSFTGVLPVLRGEER